MSAFVCRLKQTAERHAALDRALTWLASPGGVLWMAVFGFWPVWTYLFNAWVRPRADLGPPAIAVGIVAWVVFRTLSAKAALQAGPDLRLSAALVALYAVGYPFLPALAKSMLALGIVGLLLLRLPQVGTRGTFGLAALCLMAAPSVDTLTFFVGAPLRAATAQLAAVWLLLSGSQAKVEGAMLDVGHGLFSVDAPCSGVNGLWSGLVAAAIFSLLHRLSPMRTMALLASATLLCIPANAWRAASLIRFGSDAGAGTPMHAGVGLAAFGAVLIALRCIAARLSAPEEPSHLSHPTTPSTRNSALFVVAALAAALAPLFPTGSRAERLSTAFPGWPSHWLGQPLRPLPKSALDRRFAEISPAPIARFALPNGDELLLRWTDQAGRWAHAASDCYEGEGFEIIPRPPLRKPVDGADTEAVWHRFEARRGLVSYEVSTVIVSSSGETYPDPAWWWWQVVGPGATDRGPWWIATVQRRSG